VNTTHSDHHYSVTVSAADLAVVACMRALSQHCQETGNARIPWGGTKKEDWRAAGKKVTFRFSRTDYRTHFVDELNRLLPKETFVVEGTRDDDPASPQLDSR